MSKQPTKPVHRPATRPLYKKGPKLSDKPIKEKREAAFSPEQVEMIRSIVKAAISDVVKSKQPARPKLGWIAWSNDGSKKLATAATLEEAEEAARMLGEEAPVLEPEQPRFRLA